MKQAGPQNVVFLHFSTVPVGILHAAQLFKYENKPAQLLTLLSSYIASYFLVVSTLNIIIFFINSFCAYQSGWGTSILLSRFIQNLR